MCLFLLSLQLPGATKTFPVVGHQDLLPVIQGTNCVLSPFSSEGVNNFMVRYHWCWCADCSEPLEFSCHPISTTAWLYLGDHSICVCLLVL